GFLIGRKIERGERFVEAFEGSLHADRAGVGFLRGGSVVVSHVHAGRTSGRTIELPVELSASISSAAIGRALALKFVAHLGGLVVGEDGANLFAQIGVDGLRLLPAFIGLKVL